MAQPIKDSRLLLREDINLNLTGDSSIIIKVVSDLFSCFLKLAGSIMGSLESLRIQSLYLGNVTRMPVFKSSSDSRLLYFYL